MELLCSQSEALVVVDMAPSCSPSDPEKGNAELNVTE